MFEALSDRFDGIFSKLRAERTARTEAAREILSPSQPRPTPSTTAESATATEPVHDVDEGFDAVEPAAEAAPVAEVESADASEFESESEVAVHEIAVGSDATAAAYVAVDIGGRDLIWGVGLHESIVSASLRAIVSAVNSIRG